MYSNRYIIYSLVESSDEGKSDKEDLDDEPPKKRAKHGMKQSKRGGEEKESTPKTRRPSKNVTSKLDNGTTILIGMWRDP